MFIVKISDCVTYEIKNNDEEMSAEYAMDTALEWWNERIPNIEIIEQK